MANSHGSRLGPIDNKSKQGTPLRDATEEVISSDDVIGPRHDYNHVIGVCKNPGVCARRKRCQFLHEQTEKDRTQNPPRGVPFSKSMVVDMWPWNRTAALDSGGNRRPMPADGPRRPSLPVLQGLPPPVGP